MTSDRFAVLSHLQNAYKQSDWKRASVSTLIPIAGVILGESMLYIGSSQYALLFHLSTLLFCILLPLLVTDATDLFQAFGLLSCFRLVNLGMPVFFEMTLYWFPLIYGPFIPVLFLISDRSLSDLGRLNVPLVASLTVIGALLGAVLAQFEYAILEPPALIPEWSVVQLVGIGIVMVAFVGFVEEFLYRGLLQTTLVKRYGRWPGILVASGLFGLMHSGYGLRGELLIAGLIGFVFGVGYELTDSLTLVTVAHGILNVFLFAIIPFQDLQLF